MPENSDLARWIFLAGLGLILLSGFLWLFGRLNINIGQLPGDFKIERGNVSCFVPLASSLLLSVLLTILLNIILRSIRK